jgi:hypothetical protein
MGTAQHAAGYTASDDAGAHGVFAANDGAQKAACHGTANSATNDLGSARPVVCHITGIGLALANACRIGLGCQGASRHDGDKGGGENFASGHGFIFLSWTQEPPPAMEHYRHSCGVAKVRDLRAVLRVIYG